MTKPGTIKEQRAAEAMELARNESTSARVAKLASRGLRDPKALTAAEARSVCASCLTQAKKITALEGALRHELAPKKIAPGETLSSSSAL